ncbi:DUF2334 domain-containing protein [Candidatus Woesearchaeota archaeon]|nr:DUF2334 domain-containing protein [Candidatus Woesearchaeota archaeon]
MTHVVFRDDDVDEVSDQFLAYRDLMKKYEMPVTYAVIPGRTSPSSAQKLKSLKTAKDVFVQHGWMHTNHGTDTQKAEFGMREPEIEQQEILAGYAKMKDLFADDFLPVFVPPYHAYTQHTWHAAQEAGCKGFSAKKGQPVWAGMRSLPAHILFDIYRDGKHSFLSAQTALRQFLFLRKRPFVIFLTHHKNIDSYERTELEKVLRFLSQLKMRGKVTFCSFGDLLQ